MGRFLNDSEVAELLATCNSIGKAEGAIRGKLRAAIEIILIILTGKFQQIPVYIETQIRQMTDLSLLKTLTTRAINCLSLDEFAAAL